MKKKTFGFQDKLVLRINAILLTVFLIMVLYPFIYVISSSFSSGDALVEGKVWLFPVNFSLEGYQMVFSYTPIWSGYLNSLIYTVANTSLSVVLTIMAAYPLSRKDLSGHKFILFYFMLPMMFSGGLIPNFMLINQLGLMNSRWAIILPAAINVFNIIVARTFFIQNIPGELLEAAKIDGCNDIKFLLKIAIPLSGAIIAVISLWVAVGTWNSYFSALIYLNERGKMPLQIILRDLLILTSQIDFTSTSIDPKMLQRSLYMSQLLKYGTIVIGSLPLMIMYPFVQKYFVKGVMIGSIKG